MNHSRGKLNKSRRRLPHWESDGATYFVTFRLLSGGRTFHERQLVLEHIKSGDGSYYNLWSVVIMPDHVHLLFQAARGFALSRIMKGIKGVSAMLVNESRQATGSIWQDESYDRIMRDEQEALKMARYLLDNPRRSGLVEQPEDYPYLFTSI